MPATGATHLEGLTELVAHDVVQQRVDACGEEVEHAGCVVQYVEDIVEPLRLDAERRTVNRHQALCMEWRPADEECHRNGNCKKNINNNKNIKNII